VVTAEDFLANVRRVSSDPDWPPSGRLHLSDLRNVSADVSIDVGTIKKAVDIYVQKPERIADLKVAIVASEVFAKAAIFERLMSLYRLSVIVFNSLDTACTWLGIDADEAERTLQEMGAQSRAGPNA
ncbi:MAG TPA: hypothetical protein VMT60_03880, partial [Candidatus Bathyarchaeia archaeon]|nr:hypothetical protein [Candidatus Bathyarchaeia archaeon]